MSHIAGTVRIPQPSDKRIVELFAKAAAGASAPSFSIGLPRASLGEFDSAKSFFERHEGSWGTSRMLDPIAFTVRGSNNSWASVTFHRSVTEGGTRVGSLWECELVVTYSTSPQGPDAGLSLVIWQAVDGIRRSLVGTNNADAGPTPPDRDIFASQLSQLTELHNEIVRGAETARLDQEASLSQRRAAIEAEHQARLSQIEEEKAAARHKIALEEERLDALKKELDDRGHMHARRQLRADITRSLKERLARPGLSAGTRNLRLAVGGLALLGVVGFSAVAAASVVDLHTIYSGDNPSLIILAFATTRFAIPAAAAAGLLFYILGWFKRLHSEDAHSERDLERYLYDIDRSSWAIETILEAQGKEGGAVPAEWISGVTHGLFTRNGSGNEDREAVDALGSLLNFAAKAEFGPNGPKLEFSKGDLRRLSREASPSQ